MARLVAATAVSPDSPLRERSAGKVAGKDACPTGLDFDQFLAYIAAGDADGTSALLKMPPR